ncbi:hypothetical protein K3495_g1719 [Podosphaera aphanis]|nr:hypothetical protein K3495_g1719 [Podosphaera aphanis]
MDRIVPAQMGVTAAVLDNVIFCHQDDSLWPMAEPQKLKEKFDKIFDAQKYTKAIENMIKMRKQQKEELGKLTIHEANNKIMKEKADRTQKRMYALEAEIDALRDKIEEYNINIKAASEQAKAKKIASNKALGTVEELRTKRDRAEGYQSFLDTLKADLEELQESDEWLQATLDQYEERMSQYRHQSDAYQSQYSELQQAQVISRQKSALEQTERGLHQAEKKNFEAQIHSRAQLVREIARKHSIKGYDGDLSDEQIHTFVEKIQKLIQDKDRELDRLKKTTNEELLDIQKELSKLENQKGTRIQEKINAKSSIHTNDLSIKTKQKEVDMIRIDEGKVAALEASLSDIQEHFQDASTEFEIMKWDEKLKAEDSSLRELEFESNRLKDELFESNKLAKDQATLEYARTQAKSSERSMNAMVNTYNEQLIPIIGSDWNPETLEEAYQAVLDQKSQVVAEAKRRHEIAEQELRDQDFKLKTSRSSLQNKVDEMRRCEKAVLSSISTPTGEPLKDTEAYLHEVAGVEQELNDLRQEIGSISVVREYYKKSLATVREHNCCRLCERKFSNPTEKISAEGKLEKLLKKYVEEQVQEDIKALEEDLKKANAVRPQYETFKKLKTVEIPGLKQDVEKFETGKTKLTSICEQHDTFLNEKTCEKRDIEVLGHIVNDIVKYHREISKYGDEIDRISTQQKSYGTCMSIDEIQEQTAVCDEKVRLIRKKIEKLTDDKNRAKTEISGLEIERSNLSQKLNSAQFQLEKKRSLLSAIEELREQNIRLREAIQKSDDDLESLIPQFTKANSLYEDSQRRGDVKSKEVQGEKDKLTQSINKLILIENAINKYIDDGGLGQLDECEKKIKFLEQEQEKIEIELAQITQSANELNARITDSEKTRRSITSNIRYRKTLRDLETTKSEIMELESRMTFENADQLVQEYLAAEKRGQNLLAERGPLVGQMSAKDSELTALIKEWETDYQDAGAKYREMHIKVETTKAAIEDVIKCTHAVDNAVMKYHTLKMEEINAIAADLWRSTYQGTDIDSIMIRSENENTSTSIKRNYNYRLCMLKQDAELDMRGRCSAGQRVLASIIIRLALAECFGVSCGVIALDEPTTNLDSENIAALAESLNRIIRARKRQSNFQLIIITHDEEFLQAMRCNEFTDVFWRVSRDTQQKSSIKAEPLKNN